MSFNLLDLVAASYIGYAGWRGRRRGLPYELPRLLRVLVLALTGAGLWHWTNSALNQVSQVTRQQVGVVGGAGLLIGAWLLVRHFQARIREWAVQKFPGNTLQRRGGAALGGLHALVLSSFLIVFVGLLPIGPLKGPFARGSFIGRNLIRFVVPLYENVTGDHDRR